MQSWSLSKLCVHLSDFGVIASVVKGEFVE